MSYERKQIPAMIEVFEAAKAYLWDGTGYEGYDEYTFICSCIDRVSDTMEDEGPAYCALDLVTRSLDGRVTLNQWLDAEGYTEEVIENDEVMQRLRREWIDKIIADLKRFANDAD